MGEQTKLFDPLEIIFVHIMSITHHQFIELYADTCVNVLQLYQ